MAEPYRRERSPYWWFDVVVNGKRIRQSTKRTNLKEARAVIQAVTKQALDADQLKDQPELTLREALFDHYLPSVRTAASYKNLLRYCQTLCGDRPQSASLGGDTKFHDLTTSKLRQYRAKRQAQGMSEQSIDHEIKCVSAAYNLVKEDFRVHAGLSFPMARVKGKARFLMPAEEADLLKELEPTRVRAKGGGYCFMDPTAPVVRQRMDNYDLTIMLLDTGCRYSEIATLTWSLVDTMNFQWVHIYRNKVDNEGRLMTTQRMQEVLKRRWTERSNSPYVFKGWSLDGEDAPRQTTGAIRRAMAHIGINSPENVRRFGRRDVRSLRDTFATKLRQKGVSLDRLQELLGHSSPQMTQKYAHLAVSQASEEAATILDQMTGG